MAASRKNPSFPRSNHTLRSRTNKHSDARTKLRYELLEPRHLLAGDLLLDNASTSQPTSSQPSSQANAPITWFERFDNVSRVALESLATVDRPLDENVAGPQAPSIGEWIVQLTEDATADVRRVANVNALLTDNTNHFTIISGLGSSGLVLVRAQGLSRASIEASLTANESVESFSLNQLISGQATEPDDTFYPDMTNLNNRGQFGGLDDADVDAPEAWDVTTGSTKVVVGVIDSGIDAAHPDLYLNIWLNQGEIPHDRLVDFYGRDVIDSDGDDLFTFYDLNDPANFDPDDLNNSVARDFNGNSYIDAYDLLADPIWAQGADDDGNGFVDDFFGVNFRAGSSGESFGQMNPSDTLGHGTHVAGTIGAIGNNARGTSGLNWQSSLMSLKFLDENNQGDLASAISAVRYATMMRTEYDTNVRVLNNSWGQPSGFNTELESAIRESGDAGILFVAAAGNGNFLGQGVDNDRTPFYPASYELDNIITVAASDFRDNLWTSSNYGAKSVDLAAPGVGVLSTLPGYIDNTGTYIAGSYGSLNGTSMATPHVAGAAALIWSALPEATLGEVTTALLTSGTNVPGLTEKVSTGKRLNAAGAINSNVFAPAASLVSVNDITEVGTSVNEIKVRFSHRSGIDSATIDGDEILVTRLWGPADTFVPTLKPGSVAPDGEDFTAIYELTPPGGDWDPLDYGGYEISSVAGSASIIGGGRSIESRPFGEFDVRIEDDSVLYVNTYSDSLDDGTLRSAIIAANAAAPAARTIILDAGKYTIDIPAVVDPTSVFGASLDALYIFNPGGWSNETTGDFDVLGNVTIVGDTNDDTMIDAQGLDRVFKVHSAASLGLTRLTIQNGVSPVTQGGGGVLSLGELDLQLVIARKNVALNPARRDPIFGGAIAAWAGNASLNQSWLTENEANAGGGIYYSGTALGEIQRSTLSANEGGGFDSRSSADILVENSTFSANIGGRGAIVNGELRTGNGNSGSSSLSVDGRYVTFQSDASNLVPGDTNGSSDIFVYDRTAGTIERVSVSGDGAQANASSFWPALSGDGRYVTFASLARNLVPGDTNNVSDVFVYDLTTGTIERVSVSGDGAEANSSSTLPSLSSNGRYVTFRSNASNLVPGDTNGTSDVFVYDRTAGTIERVSVSNDGAQANGSSSSPSLSSDSRYVTFDSNANNLVPGDNNEATDIFLFDRITGTIDRVSVSNDGVEANGASASASVSSDGRYVTFESTASNLVPGDTNGSTDIFVFDRVAGTIERVSISDDASEANANSRSPSLSSDGRYVTFESDASNLVPGDTNGKTDIFVYDRSTDTIARVSVSDAGAEVNFISNVAFLSGNGRYVTFNSLAGNLVPGDTYGNSTDVFVYDRVAGTIDPVSYARVGPVIDVRHVTVAFDANINASSSIRGGVRVENSLFAANQVVADLDTRSASMSSNNISSDTPQSDFITPLQRLGSLPPVHRLILGNPAIDAAVHAVDLNPDQLSQIRVAPADVGSVEAVNATVTGKVYVDGNNNGLLDADEPGLSSINIDFKGITSSNFIVSTDSAGTLNIGALKPDRYTINVHLDPDAPWSVFIPPIESIRRGSVQANSDNLASSQGGDGRFLIFTSAASNLVPGDTNGTSDIFVYDRNAETLERLIVSYDGAEANGGIGSVSQSSDGRYVVFASIASNLVPGDTNGKTDIFVYDRIAGTIERLSVSNDGTQANNGSSSPSLSDDGRYVTFKSNASNLVPEDTNGSDDIFLFDRVSGTIERISVSDSGTQGNHQSFSPSLSGDGRFVTFESNADNLVPGDTNGKTDIFAYERITRTVKRVSVGKDGAESNGNSFSPFLSGDGRYVTFRSAASNLVPGDTNNTTDIFVYDRVADANERVSVSDLGTQANNISSSPSISDDGRYVTFQSNASNLVAGDTNGIADIFVYDRTDRTIERVSVSNDGTEADGNSDLPSISSDGRYISFASLASNLVPGDINGRYDIFITHNPLAEPSVTLDLKTGEIYSDLEFGLIPDPGVISGRVFEDIIPNKVYESGEPLFENWTVYLDENLNGRFDDGETSQQTLNGFYSFADIDSYREYSIGVVVPVGWTQIAPVLNNGFAWNVFLPAGGTLANRDFAFRKTPIGGQSTNSRVSGTLMRDNGGTMVPLEGVTVFLDTNGNRSRDGGERQEVTRADGSYNFTGVGATIADVVPVLDVATRQTSPLGNQFDRSVQSIFAPNQPTALSNPQAVATGFFNNDAFPDVAIAMNTGNKIVIRLGDGNGGFQPSPIEIPLPGQGAAPVALVAGKFNNNNLDDLAVANYNNGTVTIMLDFNGVTFTSTNVDVGVTPIDLAVGNIDAGDSIDLVVVSQGFQSTGPSFQVLTNNGSGTFTAERPPVPIAANNANGIVLGKFDNDAFLDVAVITDGLLEASNGSLRMFRGSGNGTFTSLSTIEVGVQPRDIVSTDFDKDGYDDVAITNFGTNTLSVLRGSESGTFQEVGKALGTAAGAFDLAVADLENDGDDDLIIGNLADKNLSIFRNRFAQSGSVSFEPGQNVGVGQFSFAQRMPIAIVDLDNSGTKDIVIVPSNGRDIHVLKNTLIGGSHRVSLTGTNSVVGLNFVTVPAILPPSFDAIANPIPIVEDGTVLPVTVSGVTMGRPTTVPSLQLQFTVTSSNPALVAEAAVAYSGGNTATVNYTTVADRSGESVLTVRAVDAGDDTVFGTEDDGVFERSFTVTVLAVNDPPTFSMPAETSVLQKAVGLTTVTGFVTGIGVGGGETGQTLNPFVVTASDTSFFTTQPAIDAAGTLTFAPNPNKAGVVPVTVSLSDNGSRANGGSDTTTKSFVVNVLDVNDPPTFVLSPGFSVQADAGPRTLPLFANTFVPGGSDETGQVVSDYLVSVDKPGLFTVLPDIDNSGTLTFTPAIDRTGVATVSVQVRDSGGRANGGDDLSVVQTFTITVTSVPDTTRPTPVISYVGAALTNQTTFDVEVDFKEALAAGTFTIDDVTVTSGTKGPLVPLGDGKYRFSYTGSDGAVTFGVAASVATDLAGNPNFAATSVVRTIDSVGVKPTVTTTLASPSNAASFPVVVAFGEAVNGFTQSDVSVVGGAVTAFAPDATVAGRYTLTVTPSAGVSGSVTVLVSGGAATDAAGNESLAADPLVRTFDFTAPTAKLTTNVPSQTNLQTFKVIAEFGEALSAAPTAASLSVTGGTTSAPVPVAGVVGAYEYTINVPANGTVTMRLVAGAVTDVAGNPSPASTDLVIVVDNNAFSPTLTSSVAARTNQTTVTVALDFGKPVTGLTASDVSLTNATAVLTPVNLSTGEYSLEVTAIADGPVNVFLAAGVVTDAAGNPNSISNLRTWTLDRVAPKPELTTNVAALTNQTSFVLTVDFKKEVDNFDVTDVVAVGATLDNFAGGVNGRYTMTATTTGGPLTFDVAAGAAMDKAGNSSLAADRLAITVDASIPTPMLETTVVTDSNASTIPVTVDFGKPVTGFDASDLLLINGSVSAFTTVDAASGQYSFTLTPTVDGAVSVLVPAGVAIDSAGNFSRPSLLLSRNVDRAKPNVTLTTTVPSRTNQTIFEVIATVSKPIGSASTVTRSDFAVTGATFSDPVALSGNRYAITLSDAIGDVSVGVVAGAVSDAVGNLNDASSTLRLTVDTSLVSPVLSSTAADSLNTDTFSVSVDFKQQVDGFGAGQVTVLGGATIENFLTVDLAAGKYSFDVKAGSTDGPVTVLVAADVVSSLAGTNNSASNSLVKVIDRVSPKPIINAQTPLVTNQSTFDVSFDFGGEVIGFELADIVVSGATLSNLRPSGLGRYLATASASDGPVSIAVDAGAVSDRAGNPSEAGTPAELTVDTTIARPTLASPVAAVSSSDVFTVNIDFGKAVLEFNREDLVVSGGVAGEVQEVDVRSGQYSADVTPDADGIVTVQVVGGAARDLAGNTTLSSAVLSRVIDRMAPKPIVSTNEPAKTNQLVFDVEVDLGDAVSELTSSGIEVTGGTASDPQLISGNRYAITITANNGPVEFRVVAGAVTDAAGNASLASETLSINVDTSALLSRLTSSSPAILTTDTFSVIANFGKQITSFGDSSVLVVGGRVTSVEPSDASLGLYEISVTADADGIVTVVVPAGVVTDGAGNTNVVSNVLSRRIDRVAPVADLSLLPIGFGNVLEVEVNFSEPVNGFDPSDLVIGGGTVSALRRNRNNTTFNIGINPTSDGDLTVSLPAGRAKDAAGLDNLAATPVSISVDISQPVPTLLGTNSATAGQFDLVISFSEPITGLTASDFLVTNATLSNLAGSGTEYTATLTAIAEGDITVSLPDERVIDAAGNRNVESSVLTLVHRVVDSIVLDNADEAIDMRTHDATVLATVKTIDIRGTGRNSLVLDAEKIAALTPNKTLVVIADQDDSIDFGDGWQFDSVEAVNGQLQRIFTNGTATVRVVGPQDWTNPVIVGDVNGSGDVTAGDALDILFSLNQPQLFDSQGMLVDAATVTPANFRFYDTNGDGTSTAADALFVINVLFLQSFEVSSEGENMHGGSALIDRPTSAFGQVDLIAVAPVELVQIRKLQGASSDVSQNHSRVIELEPAAPDEVSDEFDQVDASLASVFDWIKL